MAKKAASAKAMSKTEVYNQLAEATGLTKKQVGSVFDALSEMIGKQLSKKGPGIFTVPGLMKIKRRERKAVPAGERRVPGSNEMKWFPAKPPSTTVRVAALKRLKDMV